MPDVKSNPVTQQRVLDHEPEPAPVQNLHQITAVRIEFVEPEDQRYNTVGDWQLIDDGLLLITANNYPDNPEYSMAIALHEFIEAVACIQAGITSEEVDEFDMGEGTKYSDPGNSACAPYHIQHVIATSIERNFANHLSIKWADYEKALEDRPRKGVRNAKETKERQES